MRNKSRISELIDYYLSQDCELESLIENIKFADLKTNKEKKDYYKESLFYNVVCLKYGKREANKDMLENLKDYGVIK